MDDDLQRRRRDVVPWQHGAVHEDARDGNEPKRIREASGVVQLGWGSLPYEGGGVVQLGWGSLPYEGGGVVQLGWGSLPYEGGPYRESGDVLTFASMVFC
jgi:hypothetical protein